MLRFSMQLKILIFAIPFIIMIIWHFIPQKKDKAKEDEFNAEDNKENEDNK